MTELRVHVARTVRYAGGRGRLLLALLLTIAAAAFITAAFLRGDGSPYSAPTYETARKPSAG